MDRLNKYQKIQIILLVSIVIALIVFVMSIIKTRKVDNYSTEETFLDMTTEIKEIPEEIIETGENEEDTSWDEENTENTEVDMTEKENLEKNNEATYYLKINYTANVVTAYTKDSSGKYTVPAKAMVCSTGAATPTSGVYKLSDKYRWHQLNGGVYGQYCSRITGHILFHSVPYATNSPDTLKYTAYDKLGTKASAGCIRLTVADAMWVYNNCASGTYVEFYSSSNPGPLGKPSAQKISSNEKCRNWDPTDPISKNPWHGYTEPASTEPEKPKDDNKENSENKNNQEEDNKSDNENNGNNENNTDDNNNNNNTNGGGNDNTQAPPDNETNTDTNTSTNTSNETDGNGTTNENIVENVEKSN